MLKVFFYVSVTVTVFSYSQAHSIEELKQKYVEMIIQCSESFPITADDLEMLRIKQMPNKESVKCLFACVYKKAGMMNDNGELWIEGVNEMSRQYLSDDPVKMKKSDEFTEACKPVNDIAVSDGNKGCERAALIFQCTIEKAPHFDIV